MKNRAAEIPDEQCVEERRDHRGRPPQFGFLKIHSPNHARPDQAKAIQREPDHLET
ncbi:MAG: hypothetical protein ACXU95_18050 [Isosphaeraceae bacterium]